MISIYHALESDVHRRSPKIRKEVFSYPKLIFPDQLPPKIHSFIFKTREIKLHKHNRRLKLKVKDRVRISNRMAGILFQSHPLIPIEMIQIASREELIKIMTMKMLAEQNPI